MPRRGIGIIITPGRRPLPTIVRGVLAERVAQEQLLQRNLGRPTRHLGLETQCSRTEPADRPRGDLEDENPQHAGFRVDAAFRMNGTVAQADRRGRVRDGGRDRALNLDRGGRRRHVDRLLEERSVERIGLVEQRQQLKPTVVHQPFDRVLDAGDELLDERDVERGVAFGTNLWQPQAGRASGRTPPPIRPRSLARITPRLPDSATGLTTQGKLDGVTAAGSSPGGSVKNQGTGRPASRRRSRVSSLFRATLRRPADARQAERFRDSRADHRRPIADDQHAVDRRGLRRFDDRRNRRGLLVGEADRDRIVLPRVFEQMTPIGREDELHPEPLRRFAEGARLVAGRRG